MTEMRRSLWGPATWTFLHAAAAAVSAEDAPAFVELLQQLPRVLPCPECKQHCLAFFERRPPAEEISDAASASRYLFEFHNDVNLRTGKPAALACVVEARYGVALGGRLSSGRASSSAAERVRPYRRI
jgi:hypothetical protein